MPIITYMIRPVQVDDKAIVVISADLSERSDDILFNLSQLDTACQGDTWVS